MSNSNDVIILDSMLKGKIQELGNLLQPDKFFEIFAFDQILKNYELSDEELSSNQVDGSNDGGIDGFFIFLNNEILNEDIEDEAIKKIQKKPLIEVYLIQVKISKSFEETAIDKLISTIENIFNLDKSITDIKNFYNAKIIEKVELFRKTYLDLAIKYPILKITYIYATKGDSQTIHPKVTDKTSILCSNTQKFFRGSEVKFEFVGARELLEKAREEKSYSLQLNFLEYISLSSADNYVVLAKLDEYYKFVTDKNYLRKYLFESNVRDYQGDVEVNKDIKNTLADKNREIDFWWLNNGITILASSVNISNKIITLEDVQIVNGLQTTNTIYEYMKTLEKVNDERAILIKIIIATKLEARDRIIKATNFQTPILPASLRATESIQRDIEDYFLQNDWFYDRRKNYYKNIGKPSNRIISISYLAQAVTSIVHRKPHIARARPTSIIKSAQSYSEVFNSSMPMGVYLSCVKLMKNIELYVRASDDFSNLSFGSIGALMFHIAMLFSIKFFGKVNYTQSNVESLLKIKFEENHELLHETIREITKSTNDYLIIGPSLPINTIVKRPDFTEFIVDKVQI